MNLLMFVILTIVFVEIGNVIDPGRSSSSTKSDNILLLSEMVNSNNNNNNNVKKSAFSL
jgi:hypothetical protein